MKAVSELYAPVSGQVIEVNAALAEINATLERRVEERAHELNEANLRLRHEITEHHRAEERLGRSEARLRKASRKSSITPTSEETRPVNMSAVMRPLIRLFVMMKRW